MANDVTILDESPAESQAKPISTDRVDTDSEEVRLQRGRTQYEFEREMMLGMHGRTVQERYTAARKGLFGGFGNVKGEDPTVLVGDEPPGEVPFPPKELVREVFLPRYSATIDSHDARLQQMTFGDQERQEQGLRLAVANYAEAIMMHQAKDGNGQTQRVVSLSYIRDHCPNYNSHYFPIKYGENGADGQTLNPIPRPPGSETRNVTLEPPNNALYDITPDDISDTDRTLLEMSKQITQRGRELDRKHGAPDANAADIENERDNYLSGVRHRLRKQQIPMNYDSSEMSTRTQLQKAQEAIGSYVTEHHPGFVFTDTFLDSERLTLHLAALLCTEDGQNTVDAFITKGSQGVKEYVSTQLKNESLRGVLSFSAESFINLEDDFKRALAAETQAVHDQKFQEATTID